VASSAADLFAELAKIRTDSFYVFAAYYEQIRLFFEGSKTPGSGEER